MKPDIRQIQELGYIFLLVLNDVYSDYSNKTFNETTGAQKKIVLYLGLHGPQNMSEIARQMRVTTAAATGVVDKLVRAGLVVRSHDEHDRRAVRIDLSGAGRRMLGQLKRVHEKRLEDILEVLPPDKRRELIRSLVRAHELLSEIRTASDKKGKR